MAASCSTNPAALFDPQIYQLIQGGDPRGAIVCLLNNAVFILLFIIGTLAVIFIIIGGIQYVMSGGDEAKMRSAKGTIVAAIGGLIAALILGPVLNFIFHLFGLY